MWNFSVLELMQVQHLSSCWIMFVTMKFMLGRAKTRIGSNIVRSIECCWKPNSCASPYVLKLSIVLCCIVDSC